MPAPLDAPLRRINVFLYESDVAGLERRYGRGQVSEAVRNLVRKHMEEYRSLMQSFTGDDSGE